ncbi:Ig-like domain repeat protein [Methanobrevibacter sp.]
MTNDLTTVEGVLQQAIDDLETNLQSMGVIDAEFNPVTGILGLISRITEIEPAVAGLDLDTNITCLCESPGSVGVPLNITGILSASYDDTTATDVDLSGVLQNATVKIYNGNTLLGTAVTDNNGRYTFEYTPLATGVLSIIAIFEGTENYDNCQSSNITVDIHSLTLSSSADIVSAGDTVTLTATHLDESNIPIENETITFEIKDNSDEVIDTLTAVTDSSGIATVSYLVQGSGSLNIQAKNGIMSSKPCSIWSYNTYNLDNYLTTKTDYEYKKIWTANAGGATNLSMSGNTATLSANATAHHTKEFIDKTHYILEFNMKTASSPGYDYGFGIGEDSTNFAAIHWQANTCYIIAKSNSNNNVSFNKRYTNYVPVKITRNGNEFNFNINNGEINRTVIADVEIPNKFFMMKFSWGDISIKDMVLKC